MFRPDIDAQIQRALAHPKRREILGYLAREGAGTSESELASVLGIGTAAIEYHLRVLREIDLIGDESEAA